MLGYPNPECDRLNPKAVQLTDTERARSTTTMKTTREFGLRSTYGMDDELIAAFKERHVQIGVQVSATRRANARRCRSPTCKKSRHLITLRWSCGPATGPF